MILLVDDDKIVLESLQLLVQDAGYEADIAANGPEALTKLESNRFTLLITDSRMPGMDGRQLAQEVRRKWPLLPIILATGSTRPRSSPDITRMMVKPFSFAELKSVLAELLPE